jgi:hypothetical protein
MRIFRVATIALVAVVGAAAAGCGSGGLFQQYEYEEDVYLSLDGTATVYVNASIPALDALRGAPFDPDPRARVDRDAVRRFYTTAVTHVTAINESRHSGRRFVHVRLDVDDIRRLGETLPFAWSAYDLHLDDQRYVYRQSLGAGAGRPAVDAGWTGREVVAFRLHLPSRIEYHNAGPNNLKRGNILVWEQSLADRLRGTPLVFDAQMRTESILYSALTLFGFTCVAVAALFAVVVVAVRRSGSKSSGDSSGSGSSRGSESTT